MRRTRLKCEICSTAVHWRNVGIYCECVRQFLDIQTSAEQSHSTKTPIVLAVCKDCQLIKSYKCIIICKIQRITELFKPGLAGWLICSLVFYCTMEKKLDTLQQWCLRRILCIPLWLKPQKEMYEMIQEGRLHASWRSVHVSGDE